MKSSWFTRASALAMGCAVVMAASCSGGARPERVSASVDASAPGASDEAVRARVEELRARFQVAAHATPRAMPGRPPSMTAPQPVIGAGIASRFEPTGDAHVRAVVSKLGIAKSASVSLPTSALGAVTLEDDTSHVAVRFTLRGASDASVAVADGIAVYAGALAGSDVVHRVHAEGTEDYVVFEERPEREEIAYDVDVSRVAGLRLVSNTLEFLDAAGSPRLRVAPPFVVDASGARHEATLAIEGCAYDADPRAPWGRAVVAAGAARCGVRVTWASEVYPAVVDPSWIATGSMATVRVGHTATLLASGKVLVAGGYGGIYLASAELYDPATGTFAATSAMATSRAGSTASVLASGKVLVAAGVGGAGNSYFASAELYNPATGTFAATGAMATARGFHTANVLASGKVLVAGGQGASVLASAELYNPATGTFAPTGAMTAARQSHTANVLASGKVLVAGGVNSSSAELYDPAAGTFAPTGAMAAARAWHTASVLGSGKVLVAGGYGGSYLASTELYDPTAGTFAATGPMATARDYHTASVLASGKVLVAGGMPSGGNFTASAELYDPTAGTFAAAGSMATARESPTASVLASGKVLVAGGRGLAGELASAELLALVVNGSTACAVGDDCVSGVCNDGICCSGTCSGTCMTCTAGTGACVPVTNATDPDTCTGTMTCNATGMCVANSACTTDANCTAAQYCAATGFCQPQKANGGTCNITADCKVAATCHECTSGNCIDGVCCNAICSGQCQACDVMGSAGTCSPVTGAPHGGRVQCAGGYACDPSADMCRTSCANDADCATGFGCTSGACVPKTGATCVGPSMSKGTDNMTHDCAPFICATTGACATTCASVSDCIAPAVCDSTGACVAPPSSGGSSGGCAIARDARGDSDARAPGWLLSAVAIGAVLARRRRRAG